MLYCIINKHVAISAWLLTRTKMSVFVGARYKRVRVQYRGCEPLYTPKHVRVIYTGLHTPNNRWCWGRAEDRELKDTR